MAFLALRLIYRLFKAEGLSYHVNISKAVSIPMLFLVGITINRCYCMPMSLIFCLTSEEFRRAHQILFPKCLL